MALNEGQDYVFSRKITYVGKVGIGDGCVIGTLKTLLVEPVKVETVQWHRSITTTTFKIGGGSPVETFENLLKDPNISLSELDNFLKQVSQGKVAGCYFYDLSQVKKIRVKTSFFSRGIYINNSDRSIGGWEGYALPKPDAQKFQQFYLNHPMMERS